MRTRIILTSALVQFVSLNAGSSQEREIYEAAIRALPIEAPVSVHPKVLRMTPGEKTVFLGKAESDFLDRASPAIAGLVRDTDGISACELTAEGGCALPRAGTIVSLGPISPTGSGGRLLFVSVVMAGEEGEYRGVVFRVVMQRLRTGWEVRETVKQYAYTLGRGYSIPRRRPA